MKNSQPFVTRELSSNDDGNENGAKKMNFASFHIESLLFGRAQFLKCRRFLLELNSQGIYLGSKREKKILRRIFTSSIKCRLASFTSYSCSGRQRSTKKRDARARLLFRS